MERLQLLIICLVFQTTLENQIYSEVLEKSRYNLDFLALKISDTIGDNSQTMVLFPYDQKPVSEHDLLLRCILQNRLSRIIEISFFHLNGEVFNNIKDATLL